MTFRDLLSCDCIRISQSDDVARIVVPEGASADETGAIAICKMLNPAVSQIEVLSGRSLERKYLLEEGCWYAIDGHTTKRVGVPVDDWKLPATSDRELSRIKGE